MSARRVLTLSVISTWPVLTCGKSALFMINISASYLQFSARIDMKVERFSYCLFSKLNRVKLHSSCAKLQQKTPNFQNLLKESSTLSPFIYFLYSLVYLDAYLIIYFLFIYGFLLGT